MEKQILSTEPIGERLAILEANSEKKEKFTYSRELDIAEVQELQSELSQIMITVDQHDQQLKMAKEIYKAAVKPSKEKMRAILQNIRSQVEEVTEEVFLMKDLEAGKMGYYTKEGRLVFERRLKPEENQYSIRETFKIAK
jgi:phosphoenolpyruvate carboxylase